MIGTYLLRKWRHVILLGILVPCVFVFDLLLHHHGSVNRGGKEGNRNNVLPESKNLFLASHLQSLLDENSVHREGVMSEEDDPRSLSKKWMDLVVSPDEAKAEQSCHVIQYLHGEFPQHKVDVVDGLRLGYFDAEDGLNAIFYVHQSCAAENLTILRVTGKSHAVHITNRTTELISLRVGLIPEPFVALGQTLADLLQGETYAWLRCGTLGSHLIVPPPLQSRDGELDTRRHKGSEGFSPLVDGVVSIMLDALSRDKVSAILPKTHALLTQAENNEQSTHTAVPLRRHSIVGFNSPPNKLAVYSGTQPERFTPEDATWLWDAASSAGFIVASAENGINGAESIRDGIPNRQAPSESYWGDMPHWYAKVGNSTVGDWRWPTAALADILMVGGKPKHPSKMVQSTCQYVGRGEVSLSDGSAHFPSCAGNIAITAQKLEYVDSFLKLNRESKRAAFLSFDDPHYPGESPARLDSELSAAIKRWTTLDDESSLQNATIVLWGDHGLHFSQEFETKSGQSAHRQPAAWILLPKRWATRNHKLYLSLVKNAEGLTSHWDLHLTMLHLLTGKAQHTKTQAGTRASVFSLFTPSGDFGHRDCESAGVPPEYCPCIRNISAAMLPSRTHIYSIIAEYMNNVTMPHRDICAHFDPGGFKETGLQVIERIEPGSKDISEYWHSKRAQEGYADAVRPWVALKFQVWFEIPNVSVSWMATLTSSENTRKVIEIGSIRTLSEWQSKWDTCEAKTTNSNVFRALRDVKEICICEGGEK